MSLSAERRPKNGFFIGHHLCLYRASCRMREKEDSYDILLQHMLVFHDKFRSQYDTLRQGIPESQSAPKLHLTTLLKQSLELCRRLDAHHSIEESHIFPELAKWIPSFTRGSSHYAEHARMHQAIDRLEKYASKALRDLSSGAGRRAEAGGAGQVPKELKGTDQISDRQKWPSSIYDANKFDNLVDDLSDTLFVHLEAEERDLRGESLRKHGMTLQDIASIPL